MTMGTLTGEWIEHPLFRTGGDNRWWFSTTALEMTVYCWTRRGQRIGGHYDCINGGWARPGKTIGGKGDYSTAQRVADLAGLGAGIETGAPGGGGHSLVQIPSMNFAATYPELTRAVFLEDPPILQPGQKFGMVTKEYKSRILAK